MPAFAFCPTCAAPLPIDRERPHAPQRCVPCGAVHYHNSKPCAGTLILRDGPGGRTELLLGRRAIEPFKEYWDVPGGFLEPGEDPTVGARREAREETGLEVDVDAPYAILVDTYGTTGEYTLNLYYVARIVGGVERAADDVDELRWFPLNELPLNVAFSHVRELLGRLSVTRSEGPSGPPPDLRRARPDRP